MKPSTKPTAADLMPLDEFHPQEHSTRMRQTSEIAFRQIKDGGLLSKMRMAVYEHLYQHGPCTGQEIDEALRKSNRNRGHAHKRLPELRDLGVVSETGLKKCSVTGRMVISWDVTNLLPIKRAKKTTKPSNEAIRSTLREMRGYWRDRNEAGNAPGSDFVVVMRWLASLVACKTCNGTGEISIDDGVTDTCPDCEGRR